MTNPNRFVKTAGQLSYRLLFLFTPFFKHTIFDPRPENCLAFLKSCHKQLFSNCLVDGLLTPIV